MKFEYRKPRLTAEQEVQIASDYRSDLTLQQIADRHNISITTIYRVLERSVGDLDSTDISKNAEG